MKTMFGRCAMRGRKLPDDARASASRARALHFLQETCPAPIAPLPDSGVGRPATRACGLLARHIAAVEPERELSCAFGRGRIDRRRTSGGASDAAPATASMRTIAGVARRTFLRPAQM